MFVVTIRALGFGLLLVVVAGCGRLKRKGSDYELRFDPALFLSGEAANVAAAEDGAVPPGEPVPNDNYVVDEGHRDQQYRP